MTVDVILASALFASTLPTASVDLGQHAWGPVMSEWLDKAGEAKQWSPVQPVLRQTSHEQAQQEVSLYL